MPNHVRTIVKFKNLKSQNDVDFILNTIASPLLVAEKPCGDYIIDLNKIIPEPETKDDCPEKYIMNSDAHCEALEGREWFNWYAWRNEYWDTKWNTYDGYSKIGKSFITFVFSTAWNTPYSPLKKLSKLGYDINIKYADEDMGSNCGKMSFTKEYGWRELHGRYLPNPRKFAADIWKRY